ncbi:MAG: GtrA family protein [Candidatus Saccharibacteria bacterium]|nr:GtrA family protein [Candidatus Saccharibacteria bacterium]
MTKTRQLVLYFYNHHFVRYLFVGGTTFILSFGILKVLHGNLGLSVAVSTITAYVISFIYNFTLNRWWTFSAADTKNLHEHIIPYSLLFLFNLAYTVLMEHFLSQHVNYLIAYPFVVVTQAVWTYYTYKHVIFTKAKVET